MFLHCNTASKALGLQCLMLSGCDSTLGVFKKKYSFLLAFLCYGGHRLLWPDGDVQGHSFPAKHFFELVNTGCF